MGFAASLDQKRVLEGCDTNDQNIVVPDLDLLTEYSSPADFSVELGAIAAGDLVLHTETAIGLMVENVTATPANICYKNPDFFPISIGARAGDPFGRTGTTDPPADMHPEFEVADVVPEPTNGIGLLIAIPLICGFLRRKRS